jgi:hypothetical protein
LPVQVLFLGALELRFGELGSGEREARGNIRSNQKFPDIKALADYVLCRSAGCTKRFAAAADGLVFSVFDVRASVLAEPVNKRALLQRAAENSRLTAPHFAPIRANSKAKPLTKGGRKFETKYLAPQQRP